MSDNEFGISAGQTVLLIWNSGNSVESLENVVKQIRNIVGSKGNVKVENVERLHLGKLFILIQPHIRHYVISFNYRCIL